MNIQRTALPVIAALLIATFGGDAVADTRSEEDRARDAGRKPFEVVAFVGIEPGMNVLDVMAAAGWYTEVLSIAVGPEGHVTAQNTADSLQRREGANEKAISARLANDRLPNVSRLNKEIADLTPDDGPFDAAFTALNLHDIYNNGGDVAATGAMASIYATLKPGGVFGVIDHQGLEGQDNAALHRMLKSDAIRVAEAAGFVLEADGDILNSDLDDMTQPMWAEGIRGYTNRFLLRLRKPN